MKIFSYPVSYQHTPILSSATLATAMPSPHHNVRIIGRSKGRSAVAAAAYRHATQMQSQKGKTNDYSKKAKELVHSEIAIPAYAPAWVQDAFGQAAFEKALVEVQAEAAKKGLLISDEEAARMAWAKVSEALWNAVEDGEDRLNKFPDKAQLARSVTLALPRMLSREAQIALVQGYVAEMFTSQGMIADWVFHDTGDGNPHVHVMLTMRHIKEDDWGLKNEEWNKRSLLVQQRKCWADHANLMLEREGFVERIDHRSLKQQELALEPENYNPHVAENAVLNGEKPREKLRCAEVRRRNQAYLRAHPDHILAVVQAGRAVFGEEHVRGAFAKRLGLDAEKNPGDGIELDRLVGEAMSSPDLLVVVAGMAVSEAEGKEGRKPLYITMAKARMAQQLAQDAKVLSENGMAFAMDASERAEGLASADAIEFGSGPILMNLADWKGHERDDDGRGTAADDGTDPGTGTPVAGGDGRGRDGFAAARDGGNGSGALAASRGSKPVSGPSAAAVREALTQRAEDLFRSVFGEPVRPGAGEWRAKENEALAMRMRGPRRGLWRDYSAGDGGDLFDLVAREFCGLSSAKADFPKVLEEAARYCGIATDRTECRPQPVDDTALLARAAERERQAREAEKRDAARRAALVKDLAGRAVPVGETPAAAYLRSRGITGLPEAGLDYLPPVPGVPVLGPEHPALVVWAVDEAGTITGGQRILLGPDGSKPDLDVRKPSFGAIGGSVARFPARDGTEDGLLVIAEGPESALSIWQSTGHETWAVFGVSGFKSAPIPLDRDVILAPDRDAPDSPAGRAFRDAVAHHLGRIHEAKAGGALSIATAPEPVGSKHDLNDTLMREEGGADAVRAAIAAARPVEAYLSPDLNAGQRAAAEAMLGPDRLTLVTGHAGVGKTFTIREVARAWQARGVQVLAGAPSGKATQELAGIVGVEAATLAAWEARWARGEFPDGAAASGTGNENAGNFVFFMDEAGMVGLGQWSRLQAQIEAMGGKLIGVGDREQLQPVNDLSGWAVAERQVLASGGTIPVIDLVIRQRSEGDRTATANLARGDDAGIRAGLRHYVRTGALRLDGKALADPVAEIARAYFATPAEEAGLEVPPRARRGEDVPSVIDRWDRFGPVPGRALAHYSSAPGRIALAYTNSDVEALNEAIREEAVKRGLLNEAGSQMFEIERIERTVEDDEPLSTRKRVEIEIAAGDRIMLTRPHEKLALPRSGFGTVVAVSEGGFEVLMDGRDTECRLQETVRIDAGDFPYFDYGYAATIHKSQGMTEGEVLLLLNRFMDRYAMNVALTRHSDRVVVFGRKKHCGSVREFYRLGLRRGREYEAPETGRKIGTMVPLPGDAAILMRSDWEGPSGEVSRHHSFLSDRYLATVATRVAGLLSADHADNDPLLDPDQDDPGGYTDAPQRVIEDLVRRQGVVRADEVASVLSRQVSDPETFQRLFREAMSHPGLVALPASSPGLRPSDQRSEAGVAPWVYTSERLLKAELAAVDRGMRLAGHGVSGSVSAQADPARGKDGSSDGLSHEKDSRKLPVSLPADLPDLTPEQRGAVISTLAPGGLKIVRGGTGSGKTRVAAAVARAHEAAGGAVTVVSPTQAGCRALLEEGVEALTLGAFFSAPPSRQHALHAPAGVSVQKSSEPTSSMRSAPDESRRVIVLDDAHGLGIGRADVLLARVEMMGAKLVALVNPDRRPAEAGPVFNVLAERMSASDHLETADLTGLHGVESEGLLALAQGLRSGDRETCREGLQQAHADGLIQAAGDKEKAIEALARAYVVDKSPDKLALGWGRADADALTQAIRSRMDEVDVERRAFRAADHGPLKDLRPGDRIRFTSSGMFGVPARGGAPEEAPENEPPPAGSLGPQTERIHRGDTAQVLGAGQHGSLWLRITGTEPNVGRKSVREIAVAAEGPLPRWQFTFASTIMAAAGRRHDSIHLLGSGGMDRETLTAGALAARDALNVTMPVEETRLDAVLGRIAGRVRAPRSGLDHGFDPARAEVAAREAHRTRAAVRPGLPPPEPHEMDIDRADIARLADIPRVSLSATQLQAANVKFLGDNPDQILAIVQTDRPVFTEGDVLRGLRDRLGHVMGEGDILSLKGQVMASDDLIRLKAPAPDGSRQYVTVARAAMMRHCAEDAGRLAKGVFEAGKVPIVKPDVLSGLNPVQRAAAEAMLSPERLVLVQGHAGTGKTWTLGHVAQAWRDRGVTVLAGASSGRARDELAASLAGVDTRTLAAWEAAWARGEVPPQGTRGRRSGFVFIMDEAGMVGVGQWARLQRQVAALGGKLIAVGDPDQLQPVSDLPGWAVVERAVGQSLVMDTVLRQTNLMDREATEALARGGEGVAAALRYYAEKGAVRLEPEIRADPVGAIAREYWRGGPGLRPFEASIAPPEQSSADAESARTPEDSRIAVAATNRDVAQLNDAIRFEGLANGATGGKAGIDPTTVRRYGSITRVLPGVEGRSDRIEAPLELGVGERIILTAAHRELGLPKSSFGTVVAVREKEIDVEFDGRADPVTLDPETFRGIDYGYAATVHKAQGMGADHVHVLPHRHMNRHAVYVVLSRHKDGVTVYGRAGHAENLVDLIRMGQAAGHLDASADEIRALAETPDAGMVPGADIVGLGLRADWQAQTGTPTSSADPGRTGFAGDADLMAVAERRVGLLAATYRKGDPVLDPDVEDRRSYARFPRRVVDDLVARNSVLRAEDVEDRLAWIVKEPETFLRLYRAAMTHPDLVVLSEGDDQNTGGGRGRVYTTRAQLALELETVDLGARLALTPAPKAAPALSLDDLAKRDRALQTRLTEEMSLAHRDALHYALAPGRVRLIRGEAGSGKVQVAAEAARLHAQAGWQVLSVTPTGAGLEALERAGAEQPRTLRRFFSETAAEKSISGDVEKPARVQIDPATVVVLSHAGRLGAREMNALLERVEASGAKLVAFLGGEEQAPVEAGAVMRALEMRVGSAWLGKDRSRDAGSASVVYGLVKGGPQADEALEALERFGSLVPGGDARRAIDALAESYVADSNPDRIALTWGRADARAVTEAIRARLDLQDPARAAFATDAELKLGDRIRFLASTLWVPPAERGRDWEANRVFAGERGEVVGVDAETSTPVLRITERGGTATRDVVLTPETELPEWDYAFAGTIHGEGALVRENVHMLVSPGMTRQVLAAGVAAHCSDIRLVVPSSEKRMGEVLTRIIRREGRAESVLDYGFDPTFGAREAMRGRSVEVSARADASDEDRSGTGIDKAIDRLASLAGIERAASSPALGQGLEGEVLAEVIGAAILRDGQAPDRMSASNSKDRLAVERYVRALSDGRDWRRLLRQVPAGLPRQADDLARREAGEDGQGRLLGTARVLARGALAARALGEEKVADMFEAGLSLYGKRAELARVHGKMDELLPERADAVPTQDLPDPGDRPETAEQRQRRRQREWARNRPHGRRRGVLSEIMAGVNASDEQVARMALEVWGISDRPRRQARTMAYAWEIDALRRQQAEAARTAQDQAQAEPALDPSPQGPAQPVSTPDYTAMARELSGLIAAHNPVEDTVQPAGLEKHLAGLLARADEQMAGPWSKPGAASMEQLAARVRSLPGLEGEDKALAEVVDRALPRDTVKPVAEAPARSEEGARSADDGISVEQGQGVAPDSDAADARTAQDGKPKGRAEQSPEQLSLDLRPVPSRGDAPTPAGDQPGPTSKAGEAQDRGARPTGDEPASPFLKPGPERDEYGYPLVDWDAVDAHASAQMAEAEREMEEALAREDLDAGQEVEMDAGAKDTGKTADVQADAGATKADVPASPFLKPGPERDEYGYPLVDWDAVDAHARAQMAEAEREMEEARAREDMDAGQEVEMDAAAKDIGNTADAQAGAAKADKPAAGDETGPEEKRNYPLRYEWDDEDRWVYDPAKGERTPCAMKRHREVGLRFAIAVSRVASADDPLHQRDLPHDLGVMAARGEEALPIPRRDNADPTDLLLKSRDHFHTTEEERGFIDHVVRRHELAYNAAALPEYDGLIRDRRAVLDALSAPDRSPAPPKALLKRMEHVFTQAEILALKGEVKTLPGSVPELEAQTRARISDYLNAKGETGGEKAMDKTAQYPTRGSVEQRESILSALLLDNAGKATFNDLQKVFTFEEVRALKDPAQHLPEGLPELTKIERKTIARVLSAGPAQKSSGGGASRFEPDPRYDGRALQLACAITERVDARDPVHGSNLVMNIRTLLKAADAAAATLPADKVAEATRKLTSARVALDVKLALAAPLDGEKFNKPLFLRNVGRRGPGGRFGHPLGYATRDAKEAYDRDVDGRVQRALSENPEPTQAEVSVARITLLPTPPKGSAGLIEALEYVFEEGSLKPVEDLLKEREALLDEIADTTEMPKACEDILERVFNSFTHREVFALAKSNKRLPGTVPALDEARRVAVARGLTMITKTGGRTLASYAWEAAAETLEDGLHPERARSRSRGLGLGM